MESISAIDLSPDNVKDTVGDGGANKVNFLSEYENSDGTQCVVCSLCPGSRLNSLFDPKANSICVDCTDTDSCDQIKFISTFDKPWAMQFFTLVTSEADASM